MSGSVLVSHRFPPAVQSALKGLTSGFGMEPGVSLSPWPPKLYGDVIETNTNQNSLVVYRFPTVPREPHSGRVTPSKKKL